MTHAELQEEREYLRAGNAYLSPERGTVLREQQKKSNSAVTGIRAHACFSTPGCPTHAEFVLLKCIEACRGNRQIC